MAYFHTTVLDNQIKALPTVGEASGSIATFDTDMTENLVEVKCQIVATQGGSGTPSPSNPRPITTYTSLNLSHSGADTSNPNVTNIPFGQTVAKGLLNVGTGKLRVTDVDVDLGSLTWYKAGNADIFYSLGLGGNNKASEMLCEIYDYGGAFSGNDVAYTAGNLKVSVYTGLDHRIYIRDDDCWSMSTSDFANYLSGKKLVYELATPIEIQLDSITLQALLNENNVWCDTNGDTSVKFLLTVGKKIS